MTPSDYQANSPNADLKSVIPSATETGGLLNTALGSAGMFTQLALSCLIMLGKILLTVAAFSLVIAEIFPIMGKLKWE